MLKLLYFYKYNRPKLCDAGPQMPWPEKGKFVKRLVGGVGSGTPLPDQLCGSSCS